MLGQNEYNHANTFLFKSLGITKPTMVLIHIDIADKTRFSHHTCFHLGSVPYGADV